MSDVSSIRKARSLESQSQGGSAFYKGAVRCYNNQMYVNTGSQWSGTADVTITVPIPISANDVNQNIFIADKPYNVVSVSETHSTASSDTSCTGNTAVLGTTATGTAVLGSAGSAGTVVSITLGTGGTAYASAPTVTLSAPTSGVTATATAAINGSGIVTGYTVTNAGSGYVSAPTVTVAAPGTVASITLGAGGTGYGVAPIVTIAAPPAGSGHTTATATATISVGAVTGFTITSAGSGYVTAPTVTVAPPPGTTIAVNKCTETQTPAQGSSVLVSPLSITTAANTPQSGTVVTTAVAKMAANDRLSLSIAGNTSDNYAGGNITVVLQPL